MPKNVTQYDLLLSCPGDIKNEIEIIKEVVSQFNNSYSDVLGISIRARHWAESAYPESGGKPQDLLNKQFINKCDAAVAVFWTRFGTPTDKYDSGTEEEIEIMLKSGKQVFLYFSDISVPPSEVNGEQYANIKKLKERYKDKGLYWTYNNHEDFRKLFAAHLTKHFLALDAVNEIKAAKKPSLLIKSISLEQQLEDEVVPVRFIASRKSVEEMQEEIKILFQKINDYTDYSKLLVRAMIPNFFQEAVTINDDEKEIIKKYAKAMNIELSKDFFGLGDLKKDILGNIGLGTSPSLHGTSEEIEKRNDIRKLYKSILEVVDWKIFEDIFSKLNCIRLCVENNGTTFDEDIEITLRFSKEMIILPSDIPMAEGFNIDKADCSYYELFEIQKTAHYLDFDASIKRQNFPYIPQQSFPISMYGNRKSEEEKYYETLAEVFDYDFFIEKDCVKIKLKMDYIKHNTAVAFPTVLFVTDKVSDIEYTITSKHCDAPTNGKIKVAICPPA